MTTEKLVAVHKAAPFYPFTIRMVDGRSHRTTTLSSSPIDPGRERPSARAEGGVQHPRHDADLRDHGRDSPRHRVVSSAVVAAQEDGDFHGGRSRPHLDRLRPRNDRPEPARRPDRRDRRRAVRRHRPRGRVLRAAGQPAAAVASAGPGRPRHRRRRAGEGPARPRPCCPSSSTSSAIPTARPCSPTTPASTPRSSGPSWRGSADRCRGMAWSTPSLWPAAACPTCRATGSTAWPVTSGSTRTARTGRWPTAGG